MDTTTKTCSFCAEVIPAVAVRCPYCRSDLPAEKEPTSKPVANSDKVSSMGSVSTEPAPAIPAAATAGTPAPRTHSPARELPVAVTAPRNEPDLAIPSAKTGPSEPKTYSAVSGSKIEKTSGSKIEKTTNPEPSHPHRAAALALGPKEAAAGTPARFGPRSLVALLAVAVAVGVLATLAFIQTARKKPASIELSGLPDVIVDQSTINIRAVVRNGNGASIGNARVAFSVEPANVAAIDPQGALTCSQSGDFELIATVGDIKKRTPSRCRPVSNMTAASTLELNYIGKHRLDVNRIELDLNRVDAEKGIGTVTITKEGGGLHLHGGIRRGPHYLELSGTVEAVSPRKFFLDGELRGVPDMSWAKEPLRTRYTKGRFMFKATGQRRYWRMYEIDGRECVCGDNCGNDFCYIDIEFLQPAAETSGNP